jgi:TIR domain-containing protein
MSITGAGSLTMDQQRAPANPITIFYSYAPADERLRKQLETHLGLLRQQGIIAQWHDRQIVPGTDWAHEIDTHLATAHVILLLISPDFLASDYCYGVELRRALERDAAGEARVIPILLRPVADWGTAPFARLAVLPMNRKPITMWRHRDEAWAEVAVGIRRAIEQLQATAGSSTFSSWHARAPERQEGPIAELPGQPGAHTPIPGTSAERPVGTMKARDIHATNVVSGSQYIQQQTIYQVAAHSGVGARGLFESQPVSSDAPDRIWNIPRRNPFFTDNDATRPGARASSFC